jgi:hypothetical protein
MAKFMLIFHERPDRGFQNFSSAEAQQVLQKMQDWVNKIRASGKYVVSDKLTEEGGKVVHKQNGRITVVDGPYAEAKEVVGGYLTIRVDTYNEAIELARVCPLLEFGGRVEIRQTDSMACGGE